MDCSLRGSSVHRIFQVRVLDWDAIAFSSWWLSSKESACSTGDTSSVPGSGRSPGGGLGNPLQYSCLENPMDRGACWATVHRVAYIYAHARSVASAVSGSLQPYRYVYHFALYLKLAQHCKSTIFEYIFFKLRKQLNDLFWQSSRSKKKSGLKKVK